MIYAKPERKLQKTRRIAACGFSFSIFNEGGIALVYTTGTAGMCAAGGASRRALGDRTPIRMGEKQGEHARSVRTLAIGAGDQRVCILDRAQDIKLGVTVQAGILVERHFSFLK